MTAPHRLDVAGLHAAYAQGTATPGGVLDAYLDRIERLDPGLRSFIARDADGAARAAAESEGRVAEAALRPLEGVPVAIKANLAVSGLEWNAGMARRRGIVAARDAEAVTRLRAAGAVVLGTLNMHEAALGATTDNPWFGRTVNPHREGRTPGGSSGGSGAAVAAGLCVAALGTDTLGSIRIPAAYNGVYGIKPTNGAVPDDGLVPLARAFDCIGPLARSLDDLERVLAALAEFAPVRPFARVVTLDGLGGVDCDEAVLRGYGDALGGLPALPRVVLELPPLHDIRMAGFLECAHALVADPGFGREGLSDPLARLLDYAESRRPDRELLARTRDALRRAVGTDGVLILPTAPQPAFAHGGRAPANQADFTALANIAGLPALAIPAGRDGDGMPVGVQLVGPPGSELSLIEFARALDRALDVHAPPILF